MMRLFNTKLNSNYCQHYVKCIENAFYVNR